MHATESHNMDETALPTQAGRASSESNTVDAMRVTVLSDSSTHTTT